MVNIDKFLNNKKKYAPLIAKEIVETFQEEANQENIDYSFSISRETGQISEKETNTYFIFDTDEQTSIDKFKKALFNEDLESIEKDSIEEKKLMENVRNFLVDVCKNISDNYTEKLEETIRRVVLGGKFNKDRVPLNDIEVVSIDIADYSSIPESYKYLLKIGKEPNAEIDTDEVIKFIHNREEETGMDINTIFSIENKSGNPLFKGIVSIESGRKFLNEISIYFLADYSLKNNEENIKKLLKSDK